MVGVAGFEPELLIIKTIGIQVFFNFITFFHYIFRGAPTMDAPLSIYCLACLTA